MSNPPINHRWSGWPGAWCLDCGIEDPVEAALAAGQFEVDDDGNTTITAHIDAIECKEPGSGRFDPYRSRVTNGQLGGE